MSAAGAATYAEVAAAVAEAHRREWALVLAATVRLARDLDLAEECVQHAYAQALTVWPERGIPDRPAAWLTTVARRRALDLARSDATRQRLLPRLVGDGLTEAAAPAAEDVVTDHLDAPLGDDRLRLIFICCHPALGEEAQVALTLRLVCGLSTADVARAFLVTGATMAARITRAKKKIAIAGIPFALPPPPEWRQRIDAVLSVVYLLYTTGHTAPAGSRLMRRDLVARATDLARLLRVLLPSEPEVAALLALVLLSDARTPARVDADGRVVLLEHQDRSQWDRSAIAEGKALLAGLGGLASSPAPGRFALLAAITAVHSCASTYADTDWAALVALYDRLAERWPSPVVALNRAVALGLGEGPAAGLAAIEPLLAEPVLAAYPYLPAARADFLRRLGRTEEARTAYEEALALTTNDVERDLLSRRLAEVPSS